MERTDYYQLIHQHIAPDSQLYPIYMIHCHMVTRKALTIADKLGLAPERKQFIEEAAMLHDIGIVRTNTPSIHCYGELPYICHLVEGSAILQQAGLPRHARVAESHAGTGLTVAQIQAQKLPLPLRDLAPVTLEEEIISFADLFYSKDVNALWQEKSLAKIRASVAKYGAESLTKLETWVERFYV